MKESKRQLSKSELIELVQRQDGLCHDCGVEIARVGGADFAAHHVVDHASGGQTDMTNEVAVCTDCHSVRHDKQLWPQIREFRDRCDPRFSWQVRALFKVAKKIRDGVKVIFAEVVMSAGKTLFSLVASLLCRLKCDTDTTIIVVPKTAIGDGYAEEIRALDPSASVGRQLLPSVSRVLSPPSEHYIIVTYQAVTGKNHKNILRAIQQWKKQGWTCSFIFDEIHHAGDDASWGCIKHLYDEAELSVLLTGTAWREDDTKIAIVPYGLMGVPVPDVAYGLREAIRDRVARTTSFRFVDVVKGTGPLTWYERVDGKAVEMHADSLSEVPRDRQSGVARQLLKPDCALWTPIYQHGVEHLKIIRANQPTAMGKGLIVCEAGKDRDWNEAQWIERTANAWVRDGWGQQKPLVVTYDKPDASDRIRHFKNDPMAQWIAAINMIAEGVNIPWLMVLCLFRCVSTQTLFNQLTGRVMRTTLGGSDDEWGRVVLPRTSDHVEFAEQLEDAVRRGIIDRPPASDDRSEKGQPGVSAPRIIDAFADECGLDGGTTEGCDVPEYAITWGQKVLQQRRRAGDEVRLGLYLLTAKEINVYGGSEVLQRGASRQQMVLNLQAELRSFAKHSGMATEDAEPVFFRKIGIGRWGELETFTADDLARARSAVREMTVSAIRKMASA